MSARNRLTGLHILIVVAMTAGACSGTVPGDVADPVPVPVQAETVPSPRGVEPETTVAPIDPPGSNGEAPNPEPTVAPNPTVSPKPSRGRQPVSQNDATINEVDFENGFTYDAGFGDEVAATVTDGSFTNGEWGEQDYFSLFVTQVAFGDLDGDGADEAVVATSLNTGGSGVFDSVRVFRLVDGQVEHAGKVPFGDRADGGIYDLRIEDGFLKVWSFSTTLGACCPNEVTENRLVLGDLFLVTADRSTTRTFMTLGEPGELKFLPGTSSAVLARYASGVERSVLTLEASAGQLLTILATDGPAPVDISVTDTSTGQITSGLADIVLPSDAVYEVAITFDTEESETSTLEVIIDGGEAAPLATWSPVTEQQLITEEPFVRTSLVWPVFSADQPGVDDANVALMAFVAELDDFWIEDVTTTTTPLDDSSYEVTYDITLVTTDIVSVGFNYYDYVCCRAHPNYGQHAAVLDLAGGRIIPVEEILDLTRIGEINAIWFAVGQAQEILPTDLVEGEDVVRFDSLTLVPGGIEFGTNRGSLFGGAIGTRTVVTFEQLGDLVNPTLLERLRS